MSDKIELLLRMTSQFLRWWASQLYACWHDLLGMLIPKRRHVLKVYWEVSRLLFVDEKASGQEPIAEVPLLDGIGQLPGPPPDSLASVREQNNRVRLYVSPARAYVRQFQLPMAVLPHLDAAIGLQLPKLLPLDMSQLLSDFEVTTAGGSTHKKMADIEIVALKKAEIHTLLDNLKAWGLRVSSIHLGQPSEARSRFRFGGEGAFGHRLRLRRSDRILVGTAAVLGLACASVAATESLRSHVSLERAKSATRAAAARALVHRQELLARLEPLRALAQLEAAPTAVALLADITMLVPQNTWLTTLELNDQNLRIVGVSPTSSSVVKLMSSSQLLNEVELRSSMSLGIGTGLDRFEIAAQLKARAP